MAKQKRIVFFGTPEFAVPSLNALVEAGMAPISVVSQPARKAGRSQQDNEPAIATYAREHDLPLLQPESVKSEEFLAQMKALAPELAVVVSFGQIFPKELLEIPKKGCINLHASLLPKYRGASPIQAAIADGAKKSGVTVMQMVEELDSGPILLQQDVEIKKYDTTGTLTEKLAVAGGETLVEALSGLSKLKVRKQRDEIATYAGRLEKTDGKANWALLAPDFYNRLRAFTPWPGITAHLRGRPVKLIWGVPMDWEEAPIGSTGTFLGLRQGRLMVLCGSSTLFGLERLQRPGKAAISAADFVNGERLTVGERFA